jgi:DNA-binding protein HU-beta
MTKNQMTKSKLLASLVEKTGCSKSILEKIFVALGETVRDELREGGSVTLPGLVKLSVRDRAARSARNPSTGAVVEVPAGRVVKATLLAELKATVAD